MHRTSLLLLSLLLACNSKPPVPPAPPPVPEPGADACTAEQFVACESGEACTRLHGSLLKAHACHDHALTACDSLHCGHGCEIHHGSPQEVFCALGTTGTRDRWECAGYSNLSCPENMTCAVTNTGSDAMGVCVPKS